MKIDKIVILYITDINCTANNCEKIILFQSFDSTKSWAGFNFKPPIMATVSRMGSG